MINSVTHWIMIPNRNSTASEVMNAHKHMTFMRPTIGIKKTLFWPLCLPNEYLKPLRNVRFRSMMVSKNRDEYALHHVNYQTLSISEAKSGVCSMISTLYWHLSVSKTSQCTIKLVRR
jgi:hypothetical protein